MQGSFNEEKTKKLDLRQDESGWALWRKPNNNIGGKCKWNGCSPEPFYSSQWGQP
jgi:hypothetical protein